MAGLLVVLSQSMKQRVVMARRTKKINKHKYNTPGDKRFIDPNENQQDNTDALHRQLDNERDRDDDREEDSVSISTFSSGFRLSV